MRSNIFVFILAGIAIFATSFICAAGTAPDKSLKVVLIRHGEKPKKGDNLSCQGENRALKLPAILYQKFNKPNYSYVPALGHGESTSQARMFQTISPFAVKFNLVVNSKYDEKDYSNIAENVLNKTGTVLMVWNHSVIPNLAKKFGIKNPPSWDDKDFDSIWIITYPNGKAVLLIDKEGITPSTDCPF